jgi:large subunit ribosomal protein L17
MRHKKAFRKFSRTPAHRRAMFRNLATSLVLHKQIETTLPKAKELKRIVDKLVTLGKTDTLHNRRRAMAYLMPVNRESKDSKEKWTAVHMLFTDIAPGFSERSGGYTRVIRTRVRPGDKAQMAYIGFVEAGAVEAKGEEKTRKRRVSRSAVSGAETAAVSTEKSSGESSGSADTATAE